MVVNRGGRPLVNSGGHEEASPLLSWWTLSGWEPLLLGPYLALIDSAVDARMRLFAGASSLQCKSISETSVSPSQFNQSELISASIPYEFLAIQRPQILYYHSSGGHSNLRYSTAIYSSVSLGPDKMTARRSPSLGYLQSSAPWPFAGRMVAGPCGHTFIVHVLF